MNAASRYCGFAACLFLLIAASSIPKTSRAARARSLLIDIDRLAGINGGDTFNVRFSLLDLHVLHFANGLTTSYDMDNPFVDVVVFNSLSDLKSAFVGEWTIEYPIVPPYNSVYETYTFNIAEFPDNLLSAAPPVITSPTDGSFVPSSFTMTWAWPTSGNSLPGWATLVQEKGDGHSGSYESKRSGAEVSAAITASYGLGDHIVLRAGGYQPDTLAQFISAVTPQQPTPRYNHTILSSFTSYSTPVNVTVGNAPEPSTGMLLALGTICWLSGIRRLSKSIHLVR